MASEAQRKSVKKYNKENIKQYSLQLNKTTDIDIIEYLEKVPSKLGFIKEAIRHEIAFRGPD